MKSKPNINEKMYSAKKILKQKYVKQKSMFDYWLDHRNLKQNKVIWNTHKDHCYYPGLRKGKQEKLLLEIIRFFEELDE